ncbi:NAD-dependent epimerase/dehydratase family protein [Arthrobacter sp. Soc17.1.1.1]|uniref:NAD-dependent epimerase/dehydratase family protein n=1 Tax=Arthrobacter sp. Soc17.1.1.1 TaxID=3121277 RepID=UPI002FE4E58E
MTLYIVTGAGPVGWTLAEQLAARGDSVRILTRSGSGPEHPLIEKRGVDASDAAALAAAVAGAAAVFHCIHGSAYSVAAWRRELPAAEAVVLEAAGRQDAAVVFPESLYSYTRPEEVMTEDSERAAGSGKRGVRAALLAARAASATDTVSVVASDFYGPRVRTAHAGERMVPSVLKGTPIRLIGDPDAPPLVHLRARSRRRHDRGGRPAADAGPRAARAHPPTADTTPAR